MRLTACHECDLLQREPLLAPGAVARCVRCGGTLYRNRKDGMERALAFTIAGIVLFAVANAFPIVGLEVQGELIQTTLFGTVTTLYHDDMRLVAVLVLVTTLLMPAAEIFAMIYLLLPLRLGRRPAHAALVFRTIGLARPWGMIEVFMLGILVALVKLAHMAGVVPGIAMWSFFALMVLLAAAASAFDPREMWARLERVR